MESDAAIEFCAPFPPGGLPAVPGGWETQEFAFDGQHVQITLPANPDAFLDLPEVLAAHEHDGYMPYWCHLWPAAIDFAAAILKESWTPGLPALEVGAGIGLCGVAAGLAGLQITFSDYDRQAVRLALLNAAQNGVRDASGFFLDWRAPVSRQFPLILGCEVIYEAPNHEPLAQVLETMLAPGGAAWFADPDRHQAAGFIRLIRSRGYSVEERILPRSSASLKHRGETHLWIVRRAGG